MATADKMKKQVSIQMQAALQTRNSNLQILKFSKL